ncbi:MAG: ParA family protein [Lachnospirales bacterium]
MKKNRIIAVANQKGGVGKTTTTVNLSAILGEMGYKVLVIDSDPQGNTSSGFGIDKNNIENTLYELMLKQCYVEEATYETELENVKIIPANINLAGAEIELLGIDRREYILKDVCDNLKYLYDFIIMDCPPSLNILTLNALSASDSVLVPIQCEYYALEGLSQLIHTIELVQKKLNASLEIEGVVFTMFDSRTNLSLEVVEEVKTHLNQHVYKSIIPRNVRLSEAPSYGKPINLYDPKSKGAESYRLLAEEVIKKNVDGELL